MKLIRRGKIDKIISLYGKVITAATTGAMLTSLHLRALNEGINMVIPVRVNASGEIYVEIILLTTALLAVAYTEINNRYPLFKKTHKITKNETTKTMRD